MSTIVPFPVRVAMGAIARRDAEREQLMEACQGTATLLERNAELLTRLAMSEADNTTLIETVFKQAREIQRLRELLTHQMMPF